jgi:N-acetylneuraminate synthase
VIAEIGNNHNGDVDRALQMVELAAEAGANCVKFQMRHLDEVYRRRSLEKSSEDLGTEYILDLLRRFELTREEHRRVADHCASRGILYMCTPWDGSSIDVLESFGVPGYKVASADLTNLPLLDRLSETGKPLILSTGMSRPEEVTHTVEFLRKRDVQFVLLHCNSTYPAPFHDINLKWMERLREQHSLVGYSGHERGIAVSLAAVALGACVIERHFTLDRGMEGPDHAASLEPDEFRRLMEGIREIEQALHHLLHLLLGRLAVADDRLLDLQRGLERNRAFAGAADAFGGEANVLEIQRQRRVLALILERDIAVGQFDRGNLGHQG